MIFEVVPVVNNGDKSNKFREWLQKVNRGESTYYDKGYLEKRADLESCECLIRTAVKAIQGKFAYIGEILRQIEERRLFTTVYSQGRHDYCKNIYEYAYERFGLKKTSTFNLMCVAQQFGENGGLLPEWKDYSYSQLCEMLPMQKEERKKISPEMTIKQIRELKNEWQSVSETDENAVRAVPTTDVVEDIQTSEYDNPEDATVPSEYVQTAEPTVVPQIQTSEQTEKVRPEVLEDNIAMVLEREWVVFASLSAEDITGVARTIASSLLNFYEITLRK